MTTVQEVLDLVVSIAQTITETPHWMKLLFHPQIKILSALNIEYDKQIRSCGFIFKDLWKSLAFDNFDT